MKKRTYGEMGEVDDGPGHARGAVEDGENEEPREEEDQYVSGPYARIREPLRVPVHICCRKRPHVHPFSPQELMRIGITQMAPFSSLSLSIVSVSFNKFQAQFNLVQKIIRFNFRHLLLHFSFKPIKLNKIWWDRWFADLSLLNV